MQVTQRFVQTSRGVVTFRLHRTLDVHGGFSSRHEDWVMGGIYDDGVIVKVRVSSYAINGKPASASDVSSLEQAWEHPNPGDAFAPPFDPRYVDAYQYQSGGPSTIDFTSSVHDAGHGSGSFTYDSQENVVSYTYKPNVLPPHATSGEVTDRRSEVLPGYWTVTQETQQYKGTYGFFSAAGTVQMEYADFRRFNDLASAERAL
jgi:hypothetical protein